MTSHQGGAPKTAISLLFDLLTLYLTSYTFMLMFSYLHTTHSINGIFPVVSNLYPKFSIQLFKQMFHTYSDIN